MRLMARRIVGKETNEQRFKRIAERRTKVILEYLRLLGNCANTGSYNYNEEEVETIFSAIEKEEKRVKGLFNKPTIFSLK